MSITFSSKSFLILVSYILNRGWIDRSAKRVPTYKDITKHGMLEPKGDLMDVDEAEHEGSLDDEDEFEDIVDRFESSYNFRFEEPYVHLVVVLSLFLTTFLN